MVSDIFFVLLILKFFAQESVHKKKVKDGV
jgi:hypothetical protein